MQFVERNTNFTVNRFLLIFNFLPIHVIDRAELYVMMSDWAQNLHIGTGIASVYRFKTFAQLWLVFHAYYIKKNTQKFPWLRPVGYFG